MDNVSEKRIIEELSNLYWLCEREGIPANKLRKAKEILIAVGELDEDDKPA